MEPPQKSESVSANISREEARGKRTADQDPIDVESPTKKSATEDGPALASTDVAQRRAAKLEALTKLQNEIRDQKGMPLNTPDQKVIFGRGDPDAEVVFIGESPAEGEERTGFPFMGPAGRQLEVLIQNDIGLDVGKVYLCNILKFKPPDNHDPLVKEIESHGPFLQRQLAIIAPKLVIPMGNFSSKFVLSGFDAKKYSKMGAITETHGKVQRLPGVEFDIIPCIHPAAIRHNPKYETDLANDFALIRSHINSEEFKARPRLQSVFKKPPQTQKMISSFFTTTSTKRA